MRTLLLATLASALVMTASSASAQMNLNEGKWGPAPAVFPRGAEMSVLSGDPGKEGMFVVRLRMPAGYSIPAHNHPTDEYVTVVSGTLSLGMGDRLDHAKAATLRTGGFVMAGAKMNHYAFTPNGAVVQILAHGPFAMTYVNPADDPTRKP